MASLGFIEYADASPEVRTVYDDIMRTRTAKEWEDFIAEVGSDADQDLIFDKCRHGAKYAYAGMRFYHHYEKFARYILPCAWFAKFTLEYINRWDRYWDKMAGKFLARIEETIARDQAWHDEHCGCNHPPRVGFLADNQRCVDIRSGAITPVGIGYLDFGTNRTSRLVETP